MFPAAFSFLIFSQLQLSSPVQLSCQSGEPIRHNGQVAQVSACQKPSIKPTRDDCRQLWLDFDSARQQCIPMRFSSYCQKADWNYEEEHTVSRILNEVGAHECSEAERLIKNHHRLYLRHEGTLKISELRPLASLPYLEHLQLDGHNIQDLTPLGRLQNLRSLSLRDNQIFDLSPLLALRKLESVDLRGNSLSTANPSVQALAKRVKIKL